MKSLALITSLHLMSGAALAADADPPSPDVALFGLTTQIPANNSEVTAIVGTVPAGKRLVVQTVSYTRSVPVAGSYGSVLIQARINGITAFYTLPSVYANGVGNPGITIAAPFYANAGTQLSVTIQRTGDLSNDESSFVYISGYYVSP